MIDAGRRDSRLSLSEQERVQARKGSGKKGFGQKGFEQNRVRAKQGACFDGGRCQQPARVETKSPSD